MGFDDRDAGRADEHGAVLRRRGETPVSPRHLSLVELDMARICVCGKAPHPRQGWGAFLFPAFA